MQLTLISGLSGSGKSVALKALEDADFFCIDNLPADLIPEMVRFLDSRLEPRAAISVDVRSAGTVGALPRIVAAEKARGTDLQLLFLDSSNESLVKRFSETRRLHPLMRAGRTLPECIEDERRQLEGVAELGHHIDTSQLTPNALRSRVKDLIVLERERLTLVLESFGFKQGVPMEADFLFDARFLPNPFYDPGLKAQTGKDKDVVAFLEGETEAAHFAEEILRFLQRWLPKFALEHRTSITVAVGCTGGQHRSVYIVDRLAERLAAEYQVLARHRDLAQHRADLA
jgi:RNase adapter protein RapZ